MRQLRRNTIGGTIGCDGRDARLMLPASCGKPLQNVQPQNVQPRKQLKIGQGFSPCEIFSRWSFPQPLEQGPGD